MIDDIGAPLSGLWVQAIRPSGLEGSTDEAISDGIGAFPLRVPSWRVQWLRVQDIDQGRVVLHPSTGYERSYSPQWIRLPGTGNVFGRIAPEESAQGKLEVVATLASEHVLGPQGNPRGYFRDELWRVRVGENGTFRLDGLNADAPLSFRLERDGDLIQAWPHRVVLSKGEVRELTLDLASRFPIQGLLVDQHGEAVPNAKIWLLESRDPSARRLRPTDRSNVRQLVTSDGQGHFRFKAVEEGTWMVGPACTEETVALGVAPVSNVVEVAAEAPPLNVRLETWLGLELEGEVETPASTPADGVRVFLECADGARTTAVSDTSGHFIARGLRPLEYKLHAGGFDQGYARSDTLTATPGDGSELRLVLRADGALHGRIMSSGHPVTDGMLLVSSSGSHDRDGGWIMIGVHIDGSFRVDGLRPGFYDLLIGREDGTFAIARTVMVQASSETPQAIDLDLKQGNEFQLEAGPDVQWIGFEVFSDGAFIDFGSLRKSGEIYTLAASPGLIEVRTRDSRGRQRVQSVDLSQSLRTVLILTENR